MGLIQRIVDFLHPPHISRDVQQRLESTARVIERDSEKVTEKLASVAADSDPLRMFIHEVKGASFRRQIREEMAAGGK